MTGTLHRAAVEAVLDRDGPVHHAVIGRDDVVGFVLGQLRALPLPVRLGVDAVGLLVKGVTVAAGTRGNLDVARLTEAVPLRPVRLYVRLIRSLTLFAAYEAQGAVAPR